MKSISVRLSEDEFNMLEKLREDTFKAFGITLSRHGLLKQAINNGFQSIAKFTK